MTGEVQEQHVIWAAIVEEVLKVAGIDALIPLYADVGSACAGLKTAAETQ